MQNHKKKIYPTDTSGKCSHLSGNRNVPQNGQHKLLPTSVSTSDRVTNQFAQWIAAPAEPNVHADHLRNSG